MRWTIKGEKTMLCALIMAGGTGKRFWPLSTEDHPKQMLKLISDQTMIRETVDRIQPLIPVERIFIGTNVIQAKAIKDELPMIPEDNIIIEPSFKDTAAAIGYGSLYITRQVKDATLVVLASDHSVKDPQGFRNIISDATEKAFINRTIVTLGIKPTRPEIGYGYIKINDEPKLGEISQVEKFLEKPDLEKAKQYMADSHYLWNSGMFIFKARTILHEIEKLMPKHHRVLKNLSFYIDQGITGMKLCKKTEPLYDDFEKISIDYGIMERSENIQVIPCEIGWNDIGSFTAFEDVYESDEENNVIRDTEYQGVNSAGNIVLTDNLEVKVVGLHDFIVVQHDNKLLICNKYEVDDVKKLF